MIDLPMYIHIIFSYLAAVGFAVFLNAPKKTLYISGIVGMTSWVVYVVLIRLNLDMMTSNFIAASVATVLSEILARKMKKPTVLFIVPGIITLIPGLGLYNTMYFAIEQKFQEFFATGANVMFSSTAIALGVIVSFSLIRSYYKNKSFNKTNNIDFFKNKNCG